MTESHYHGAGTPRPVLSHLVVADKLSDERLWHSHWTKTTMQAQTQLAIAGILFLAGYLIYRALLPKVIAGIPYHTASARSILGDIPDALRWNAKHAELFSFLSNRLEELDSPIAQVFLRLGGKPFVVIADFREAQDIMTKRTREFDRATIFGDLVSALGPDHHSHMDTNDDWRAHRKLIADCMSPSLYAPCRHRIGLRTHGLTCWI